MAFKCEKEGYVKKFLLYRKILNVKEYRRLSALSDVTGKMLNHLKEQLAEPSGPGEEFWWCPITDMDLLKVKFVGDPIKIAVVTDGNAAIICELPNRIPREMFVKVD